MKKMKGKSKRAECGRHFRVIRRLAASFAERVDFSSAAVKALKEMQYSSADDFVCTAAVLPAGSEAENRIVRAHIMSALVYAVGLSSERTSITFDDIETLHVHDGKEIVLNFTFGFDIEEAR